MIMIEHVIKKRPIQFRLHSLSSLSQDDGALLWFYSHLVWSAQGFGEPRTNSRNNPTASITIT